MNLETWPNSRIIWRVHLPLRSKAGVYYIYMLCRSPRSVRLGGGAFFEGIKESPWQNSWWTYSYGNDLQLTQPDGGVHGISWDIPSSKLTDIAMENGAFLNDLPLMEISHSYASLPEDTTVVTTVVINDISTSNCSFVRVSKYLNDDHGV